MYFQQTPHLLFWMVRFSCSSSNQFCHWCPDYAGRDNETPYVFVLIPITKLHGFDFEACKQKIRLYPDHLSVSICCWIQRSIACLFSELIFSMLTRFFNVFFFSFTCTCLCCKRVSFKCVYRICKTLGCCLKAHFVDPLCQARVQPGASLSTGHRLHHARSCSARTGKWTPYALALLPLSTVHRHPADRMQNHLRFLSKPCFLFLILCLVLHSPLSCCVSFLNPLLRLLLSHNKLVSLFQCRGCRGLSLPLRGGCSFKPCGEAMNCFSRPFHTRQGSLLGLEETRAGKQAKRFACVDKWFSTGVLLSELKCARRLFLQCYINVIDSRWSV